MKNEILEYLNGFQDHEYHKINDFLKKDYNGHERLTEIRTALTGLVSDKLIDVAGSIPHSRLGLGTKFGNSDINVDADLDNWPVRAKILEPGREKVMDLKDKKLSSQKAWYDTENAKRQFENYPIVEKRAKDAEKRANIALIVSIATVVVTILLKIIFG